MRWFQPQSCLLSLAFVLALAPQVGAASLTVAWDPPSDSNTAGYKVFYGTSPGVYTEEIDAGFVTQRVVDGLAEGVTYYFAVQAYSITGVLSDLSTFAEGTTPTTSTRKGKGGSGREKPSKGKPSATITDDSYIDVEWVPEADDTSADSPIVADVAADTATAPAVSIGYRVEVGTGPGDTSYSAVTRAHSVRFEMADLPAETYFIRVRPFAGTTYRPVSEEVSVSPDRPVPPGAAVNPSAGGRCVGAPKAPRQLNANARGAAVSLHWTRGPGDAPASFLLQVGSQPGLQDLLITQFAGNVYGVSAMAANAAYALRLSALNDCGSSLWAPETMLYVGVEPLPGMPQALTQTVSDGLVTLAWEPPPSGGPVTRYLIEATTAFGPFVYDTGSQATGFSHANTPPGQYVVTVRAGNATGFGVASPPVVVVVP